MDNNNRLRLRLAAYAVAMFLAAFMAFAHYSNNRTFHLAGRVVEYAGMVAAACLAIWICISRIKERFPTT